MTGKLGADTSSYKVVINHEQQFSIWPAYMENPQGWNDVGMRGTRQECLTHIRQVWVDMRPQSLRDQMAQAAQ